MAWRPTFAFFTLLLSPACGKTAADPEPIHWHTRIESACREAKERDKRVFVYFAAEWDASSKELDSKTFNDPRVRAVFRRDYVALHIDRSETYWGVKRGLPDGDAREAEDATARFKPYEGKSATLLVLRPDCATEVVREYGFVSPQELASRLAR
jgi:hypothetical protein